MAVVVKLVQQRVNVRLVQLSVNAQVPQPPEVTVTQAGRQTVTIRTTGIRGPVGPEGPKGTDGAASIPQTLDGGNF